MTMTTPIGVLPASTSDGEEVVAVLAFSYDVENGMKVVDCLLDQISSMLSSLNSKVVGTEWGGVVVVPGYGSVEVTLKYTEQEVKDMEEMDREEE